MYNVITNQNDEIYVTDTNEILTLDALTKKDLDLALENYLPLSAGSSKVITGDLYLSGKLSNGTNEVTIDDIVNKVDKIEGKGLSTEDFTNDYKSQVDSNTSARHTHSNKSVLDETTASYTIEEKTKLSEVEAGAKKNVQSNWEQTDTTADDYIKNKPIIPDEAKLYSTTGQNTDGSMTQKSITDELANIENNKVDKVTGKGLSTEDFTTELKEKLVSIDTTIAQNTLSIGSVSSGTTASATITGTAPNQILNLVLPKGDTGDKGDKGEQGIQGDKGDKGDTGATPVITATSTTLPAGSSATVTKSGTAENPNFEFGIPKGEKGDKGDKGDSGLIYQTTGQNTDGVMSQKATTDALNGKANLSGGNAFTGIQTFDNIIVKNEIKAPAAFDLYLQNGSDRVTKFGKNADGILWSDGKITTTGIRIGSWLINQDSSGNLIFS